MQNLTSEEWRPVAGLEDYFMVSNLGRVKSLDRTKQYSQHNKFGNISLVTRSFKGQILKPHTVGTRKERLGINLANGGGIEKDCRLVHRFILARLVWENFNGEIPEGYWIHHKNRDWKDCRLENLSMEKAESVLSKRDISNFGKYQRKKRG